MAVQTLKKGQSLTLTATEDELILLPPYNVQNQVRFINVSGTSKFGIGGPVFSDTNATAYTTAGTVVTLTLDMVKQADPDLSNSVHRVHCSGVGVWKVEY